MLDSRVLGLAWLPNSGAWIMSALTKNIVKKERKKEERKREKIEFLLKE